MVARAGLYPSSPNADWIAFIIDVHNIWHISIWWKSSGEWECPPMSEILNCCGLSPITMYIAKRRSKLLSTYAEPSSTLFQECLVSASAPNIWSTHHIVWVAIVINYNLMKWCEVALQLGPMPTHTHTHTTTTTGKTQMTVIAWSVYWPMSPQTVVVRDTW